MSSSSRWSIRWNCPDGLLEAREPTAAEVEQVADRLSAWYNEAYNRSMMSNETEMDRTAVIDHYAQVERDGGRNFLLYWQGQLMGDADLRHIDHAAGTAEFAILIGERPRQGRGFGARFAVMVHALAFGDLRLDRIYVSIIPANRASLRLFEKIGYSPDVTPAARRYIDEPDDVTLSLERTAYARLHAEAAGQLVMTYA